MKLNDRSAKENYSIASNKYELEKYEKIKFDSRFYHVNTVNIRSGSKN